MYLKYELLSGFWWMLRFHTHFSSWPKGLVFSPLQYRYVVYITLNQQWIVMELITVLRNGNIIRQCRMDSCICFCNNKLPETNSPSKVMKFDQHCHASVVTLESINDHHLVGNDFLGLLLAIAHDQKKLNHKLVKIRWKKGKMRIAF